MIYLCNYNQRTILPEDCSEFILMDRPEWKWNLVRLCNRKGKEWNIHCPSPAMILWLGAKDIRLTLALCGVGDILEHKSI